MKGSRRRLRGAALSLALAAWLPSIAGASPAHAEGYTPWRKAGRGMASLATGFLEIPGRMTEEARARGILSGIGVGFAKGIGALAPRYLTGVYELLTWPFPLPRHYEPLLRPEFPWQYFEAPPPPER